MIAPYLDRPETVIMSPPPSRRTSVGELSLHPEDFSELAREQMSLLSNQKTPVGPESLSGTQYGPG